MVLPNDATLHEFRARVLFAVGKYDLAAGPLYAVLSVGPGWDWTTMAGLYLDIEVYTTQLRKLEAYLTANPTSTAGRFVLAYHDLTQGNIDVAVAQLKEVVTLAPQDTLSAQSSSSSCCPRRHQTPRRQLPRRHPRQRRPCTGIWPENGPLTRPGIRKSTCTSAPTKRSPGRSQPRVSPGNSPGNGHSLIIYLRWPRKEKRKGLVGRVKWQAHDKWTFRVIGTGPEDQGLVFTR